MSIIVVKRRHNMHMGFLRVLRLTPSEKDLTKIEYLSKTIQRRKMHLYFKIRLHFRESCSLRVP